jgi:hypothetical protein
MGGSAPAPGVEQHLPRDRRTRQDQARPGPVVFLVGTAPGEPDRCLKTLTCMLCRDEVRLVRRAPAAVGSTTRSADLSLRPGRQSRALVAPTRCTSASDPNAERDRPASGSLRVAAVLHVDRSVMAGPAQRADLDDRCGCQRSVMHVERALAATCPRHRVVIA